MASQGQTFRLLDGIGVLEFSRAIGARYCGRLFSVLGATVFRIGAPDAATHYDAWLDEGKLSATDLPDAVHQLDRQGLAPDAAIAGLTPEDTVEAARRLKALAVESLKLNLTWFGPDGPYAGWAGDDAAILGLSGLAFGFGEAGGPPILAQGRAPQMIGGATLFVAGLAALWARRSGRSAEQVEVSILESVLCFTEHTPPVAASRPAPAGRQGLNRYGLYPATAYRTADGWVSVTAHTPAQWQALCRLLNRQDLLAEPRFATGVDRATHADEVDDALAHLFEGRTTEAWVSAGQAARIPIGPAPTPREVLATPHWRGRGSFRPVPDAPEILAPGLPIRGNFDGALQAAAPVEGQLPLSGVRVLDFTMGWAGPLATRHLADLGAEVVKVEGEAHFDWARGFAPAPGSDPPAHETASSFNLMNRNKRGVALDLTIEPGRAQALALARQADIVVENQGPGVMDRFGLSPQRLLAERPGLVLVTMGAFGAEGPWKDFRAYGSTVEHASSAPFINGCEGWPPALQHVAYGDPVAGIFAAAAALAGLHGRRRLGGGHLDLSQVECIFQLISEDLIQGQVQGAWVRRGSRSERVSPRCVLRCIDGAWVAISSPDDAAWSALARLAGREDWREDRELSTPEGRNDRADEIEAVLQDWASGRSADDAVRALQGRGIPAAPILRPHDLEQEPHLAAVGTWAWMDRLHVGRHMMLAPPYRIDGRRPPLRFPAPLLGEHSSEVLSDP